MHRIQPHVEYFQVVARRQLGNCVIRARGNLTYSFTYFAGFLHLAYIWVTQKSTPVKFVKIPQPGNIFHITNEQSDFQRRTRAVIEK